LAVTVARRPIAPETAARCRRKAALRLPAASGVAAARGISPAWLP
jgi:hypothetical protein